MYEFNNEILVQEKMNIYLFSPLSVWRSLWCWHLSQDWTRINTLISYVHLCIMECLAKDWCAVVFLDNLPYRWISIKVQTGRCVLLSPIWISHLEPPSPSMEPPAPLFNSRVYKTINFLRKNKKSSERGKWKRYRNITQAASQMH